MSGAGSRKEIAADVFLTTRRTENPVAFEYVIECNKFNRVEFVLDAEGSRNMAFENGTLSCTTMVQPFQRTVVGRAHVATPGGAWQFRCKYSWRVLEPEAEQVAAVVQRDQDRITALMRTAAELRFDADSATRDSILSQCALHNVNFVDLEFPPQDSSLCHESDLPALGQVTWRRPCEFMQGPFAVFAGAIEPSDIHQGSLGNCWLMCALSSLAEFPVLVENLFRCPGAPWPPRPNDAGYYTVRLCKDGEWRNVVVDDYFPCRPEGGPIFSTSRSNGLWVLLVEKAFAKLHGNYFQLRNGWAHEALMDLTGAPAFTLMLKNGSVQEDIVSGKLFRDLLRYDRLGYLMSCSTPGQDVFTESGLRPAEGEGPGLVQGHAYTLLRVCETRAGHRLLELRNPWGSFEWNGDWSDNSPLWTEELRQEVGATLEEDDGLFWMSFDDFLKHFTSVNVCEVRAHHPEVPQWCEKRLKGEFRYLADKADVSTGMYRLHVPRGTRVCVGVHQQDERVDSAKPYLEIGVTLMRLRGTGHELVASTGASVDREAQLELELEAGDYVAVPITCGCRFALARHSEPEEPLPLTPQEGGGRAALGSAGSGGLFSTGVDAALREMFRRLDHDMDSLLVRKELDDFLLHTEGCHVSDEVYDWMMKMFDSRDGGLTPDGFVECYVYMFNMSGRDSHTLWRDLKHMGYDSGLDLANARTYVITVHSEAPTSLEEMDFDEVLFEEAVELPVVKFGQATEYQQGKVTLYTRKSGYWGASFAAENRSGRDIEFTLDFTGSKNVVSHRGSLAWSVRIPNGEVKLLHHLMPAEHKDWAWALQPSYKFV